MAEDPVIKVTPDQMITLAKAASPSSLPPRGLSQRNKWLFISLCIALVLLAVAGTMIAIRSGETSEQADSNTAQAVKNKDRLSRTIIKQDRLIIRLGKAGINGLDGLNGKPGPAGRAGLRGKPGIDGLPGERGSAGPAGPQGEKGERGDKGDKGDTGSTGSQGDRGAQGSPGSDGDDGAPGANGADGVSPPPITSLTCAPSVDPMAQPGTLTCVPGSQ